MGGEVPRRTLYFAVRSKRRSGKRVAYIFAYAEAEQVELSVLWGNARMIFYHALKHDLPTLAHFLRVHARSGDFSEVALIDELHLDSARGVVDLYEGSLSVEEIKAELSSVLRAEGVDSPASYADWLAREGATQRFGVYLNRSLSDGSVWTLRRLYEGHDELAGFVHIHPARSSPHTFRVKANTFRTAAFVFFCQQRTPGLPLTLARLNMLREKIALSPVKTKKGPIEQLLQKLSSA